MDFVKSQQRELEHDLAVLKAPAARKFQLLLLLSIGLSIIQSFFLLLFLFLFFFLFVLVRVCYVSIVH